MNKIETPTVLMPVKAEDSVRFFQNKKSKNAVVMFMKLTTKEYTYIGKRQLETAQRISSNEINFVNYLSRSITLYNLN